MQDAFSYMTPMNGLRNDSPFNHCVVFKGSPCLDRVRKQHGYLNEYIQPRPRLNSIDFIPLKYSKQCRRLEKQ